MKTPDLIAAIDTEIARLEEVRDLLTAGMGAASKSKRAGKRAVKAVKRKLSPEARERIRQAQIKRWAKAKKASAK
jgi:hypothetical protein